MLSQSASVEALLFVAGEPLEKKRIITLLGCTADELSTALDELEQTLRGRGLALITAGDEVELRTAPEASSIVQKLRESELSRDLGKASLETLAVISYQHGVSRSEIDWIRGVNSSASVRTLLLRGLIEAREDPVDKRRMRYNLTTEALAHLGVGSSEELPRFAELARAAKEVGATEPHTESAP